MGSTPTQQLEADLNGTGTLVDITAYVSDNRYVHRYGRTDWSSPTQPAGSFTVTLENLDGRFTPGSAATYTRGVVRNMVVDWTCGARARRFYLATATLAFPTGVAGMSLVTLHCVDALALLAARPMQALVRETVLAGSPVAYWPCDESVSDGVQFADISGNGQPALLPFVKESGVNPVFGVNPDYHAGGGRGPRTDGAGTPILNSADSLSPPVSVTGAETRGGLRNTVAVALDPPGSIALNRQITIPDQPAYFWTGGGTDPTLTTYRTSGWLNSLGSAYEYVLSFWFSIQDIYGPAVGGGAATDGPYVVLAEVTLQGSNGGGFVIMWRIADRKLLVAGAADIAELSTDSYSVSPSDVHHLAVSIRHKEDSWNGVSYVSVLAGIQGALDGVALSNSGIDLGSVQLPIGVTLGTHVMGDQHPTRSGADQTMYALTGGIGNVSIHGPAEAGSAGAWPRAADVWDTGTTGPVESASDRLTRVGELAGRLLPADLDYDPQGTGQVGLLGPHDTRGKDALTVICETLACEEASLTTEVVAGADTVLAWLDSTQRSLTPALTVDAQDDAADTPELGFDLSGVVATAEAKSWGQTADWTDTEAAAQWQGSRATVTAAVVEPAGLLLLAQYRTVKGRATKISPTRATVNATGSTADVTADLLALYPGATVRITGMPDDKVGYDEIDCILVGVSERHEHGRNLFELALIPRGAELHADPELSTEGPWRLIDQPEWAISPISGLLIQNGWSGSFMRLAGGTNGVQLDASATTIYVISNLYMPPLSSGSTQTNTIPETFLSEDADDYPISIQVDDEIITLPNPAGAPALTTGAIASMAWVQTVTGVTRGALGSTAATHGDSTASTWNTSALTKDQGITVLTDDDHLPLAAY